MRDAFDEINLSEKTADLIFYLKDRGDEPGEAMVTLLLAAAMLAWANDLDKKFFQEGVDACWADVKLHYRGTEN